MSSTTEDSEIVQLQTDLYELKEQVKKLKQAEYSYAAELAAFRSNYQRLDKYFNTLLSAEKKRSGYGIEIDEVLKGIKRSRPIKPHWLLQFLLGNHLTYKLITSADQLAYKKDYENLKITVTIIHLILSVIGLLGIKIGKLPVFYDGLIPLHNVIAYWIMIGRETVLKMNGSNIRGWWFAHHIISMILCAVMIIWDKQGDGDYNQLRTSLFLFYLYIGSVQVLQYRYQMNRLYALRSLSRVDPMETTNELSQNLIHHNLLYLLPWLLFAYAAEFYLAHLIWSKRNGPVSMTISFLYFALATGNTLTTCYTYYRKIFFGNKRVAIEESGKKILLVRQFTRSAEDVSVKSE